MTPAPRLSDFADRLPSGSVLPDYRGRSILNLPATLGALLGVADGWVGPSLAPSLYAPLAGDWKRVILLLVDGVGWNRLERELERDDAGYLALEERYGLARQPLTSVSPSTTSVATTSLLGNGAAPAEHGMLGYTYWLPSLDLIANALFWKPAFAPFAASGSLEDLGLAPETFLPAPSLFATLAAGGVPSRALLPSTIAHSPLSRMQLRGAAVEGFEGAPDLLARLERWQAHDNGPAFAYGYLPDFDSLSHCDGPDAPSWSELWRGFVRAFSGFVERLDPETLLLVTADHGHVFTPLTERRTWQQHPELQRLCRCPPGGEARHSYLYADPAKRSALLGYCHDHLAASFTVLDGAEALAGGLYGPVGRLHPEAVARVGDVVLLARGGASFWDASNDAQLLGMHGALEADEMLVPLAAFSTR